MIVFGAITPHPPLLIPGIEKNDRDKIAKTEKAMLDLSEKLAESEPDTIIFITPHSLLYPDLFNICDIQNLKGDFVEFGDKSDSWSGQNDLDLAERIARKAEDEGVPTILFNNGDDQFALDHGIMVPLYFLKQKIDYNFKIIPIGYTYGSRAEHYLFGQIIASVCEQTSRRIAIIASGDLSHRLDMKAPDGFSYDGEKFDQEFVELIKEADAYTLMNMDEELVENAGECGYKSALILLGAMSNLRFQPEIYSYEGPFGVGYLVANMNVEAKEK